MMSRCAPFGWRSRVATGGSEERAYAVGMQDEIVIDLRRTQLLAVNASLTDAGRALFRASRITSPFASEVRALLAAVADLERRVLVETQK
jgi:hypothetical protein